MKKYILFLPLFAVLFFSCTNNTVKPPLTTEPVQMGNVPAADISLETSGTIIKSGSLGSGPLNFTDRDSTIIAFSYKGSPGNTADYQLQVYDSTSSGITSIYTFRDNDINDSLKTVTKFLPSNRDFAYYYYSIKCSGTAPQYLSIRSLTLYKK